MNTRRSGGGLSAQQHQSSVVENFKPKAEWKHEEQASFLLVYLPGFAVDQLTITPDYSNATVRIEGKRRLPNYRMLPVDETFNIPQHLDLYKMDKQFGRGILMLKIPSNPDIQSKQQSPVEDTTKLHPETPPMDDTASIDGKPVDNARAAAKPERTTDEAAAPAMDETAKTEKEKSAGDGERESPETVKDDVSKEESKESAMDSVTKVEKVEEREKGNKGTEKEDRALIVNMGIAVFMLMGLGISLIYSLGH